MGRGTAVLRPGTRVTERGGEGKESGAGRWAGTAERGEREAGRDSDSGENRTDCRQEGDRHGGSHRKPLAWAHAAACKSIIFCWQNSRGVVPERASAFYSM